MHDDYGNGPYRAHLLLVDPDRSGVSVFVHADVGHWRLQKHGDNVCHALPRLMARPGGAVVHHATVSVARCCCPTRAVARWLKSWVLVPDSVWFSSLSCNHARLLGMIPIVLPVWGFSAAVQHHQQRRSWRGGGCEANHVFACGLEAVPLPGGRPAPQNCPADLSMLRVS